MMHAFDQTNSSLRAKSKSLPVGSDFVFPSLLSFQITQLRDKVCKKLLSLPYLPLSWEKILILRRASLSEIKIPEILKRFRDDLKKSERRRKDHISLHLTRSAGLKFHEYKWKSLRKETFARHKNKYFSWNFQKKYFRMNCLSNSRVQFSVRIEIRATISVNKRLNCKLDFTNPAILFISRSFYFNSARSLVIQIVI